MGVIEKPEFLRRLKDRQLKAVNGILQEYGLDLTPFGSDIFAAYFLQLFIHNDVVSYGQVNACLLHKYDLKPDDES